MKERFIVEASTSLQTRGLIGQEGKQQQQTP